MLFSFFRPDMAFCDVYTITPEALKELGVSGVVFDIDNTVAPYEIERPTEKMKEYFNSVFALTGFEFNGNNIPT